MCDDDIDGDGVNNDQDSNDFDATICQDLDGDGCNDCSQVNPPDVNNDGPDADNNGECDAASDDDEVGQLDNYGVTGQDISAAMSNVDCEGEWINKLIEFLGLGGGETQTNMAVCPDGEPWNLEMLENCPHWSPRNLEIFAICLN